MRGNSGIKNEKLFCYYMWQIGYFSMQNNLFTIIITTYFPMQHVDVADS